MKLLVNVASIFLSVTLAAASARAQVLIDFDDIAGFPGPFDPGTLVPPQYIATDRYLPLGVRFGSGGPGIAISAASNFVSHPNVANATGPGGTISYTHRVLATFEQIGQPAVVDTVSITLTNSSSPSRLDAYDLMGNLVDSAVGGASATLTVAKPGEIHSVQIVQGPMAFDDFTFDGLAPTGSTAFCTAKSGLACGPPSITATGHSSASATSGFVIEAAPARGDRLGVLLYNTSTGPALPFQGGILCLATNGIRRGGPTNSLGSPNQCDGVFGIDMNAFAQGLWVVPPTGAIPPHSPASYLLVPGTSVFAQFWGRDSVATGSFVSSGIGWVIGS